jgi:hypothetical protein
VVVAGGETLIKLHELAALVRIAQDALDRVGGRLRHRL